MSAQSWHLDEHLAERYATGQTGQTLAASVEQHLIGCPSCRGALSKYVDHRRSDQVWTNVLVHIQAPKPRGVERLLRSCGMVESTARLLAVTPTLHGSWLSGVLFVLVLAQVVARSEPVGIALYMALAPVLPVISVAAAFGGQMDPTREMVGAAPYPMMRLLFLRTAAVVGATVVPAAAIAMLLPGSMWLALGWLLPSLALTSVLILTPQHLALPIAAFLSTAWIGLVATGWLRHNDPYVAATLTVQMVSLGALVIVIVVLLTRQENPHLRRIP